MMSFNLCNNSIETRLAHTQYAVITNICANVKIQFKKKTLQIAIQIHHILHLLTSILNLFT